MVKIKHDAKIGDKVEYNQADYKIVKIESTIYLESLYGTKRTVRVEGKNIDNVEWIGNE